MTTLEIMADSSSARTTAFGSGDAANLGSPMSLGASSRSRFFALHSALQSIHGLVSPRIVTVSAVLAICLGLLVVIA